jgi:nitrile hydratase subunit beta
VAQLDAATGKIRMEQTYVVRFEIKDLWPEAPNSRDALLIDMWDSYIDAA